MVDVSAKNIVAKRIRVARAELDMSQSDLGELIDASAQNIARWESGDINLGVDSLERIAKALGKPIEWFFQPFEQTSHRGAAKVKPPHPKGRQGDLDAAA